MTYAGGICDAQCPSEAEPGAEIPWLLASKAKVRPAGGADVHPQLQRALPFHQRGAQRGLQGRAFEGVRKELERHSACCSRGLRGDPLGALAWCSQIFIKPLVTARNSPCRKFLGCRTPMLTTSHYALWLQLGA